MRNSVTLQSLANPATHIVQPSLSSHSLDTAMAPSLFENHLLSAKTEGPRLHFTDFDFGVASILLVAFILFVWLYSTNRKRLTQVLKTFYVTRFNNQMGRDELSLGNRVSIFLSILFVLTSSLFVYQIGVYYGYEMDAGFFFFVKLALLIIMIYGFKMIFVKFFGFVFQTQKEASEYTLLIFHFCNILGLLLLPIVICLAFVTDIHPRIFINSGLCVFGLLLLIRMLRGVLIGVNSTRVSKFYLFLYLCTLEILPFVIMTKVFMQNMD